MIRLLFATILTMSAAKWRVTGGGMPHGHRHGSTCRAHRQYG